MDTTRLEFSCECNKVSGVLLVEKKLPGNHIKCYCVDCQNFQGLLNNPFNKLDPNGGSEVYQTYPALFRIRSGAENISCFKFSEKGIYRWYTSCCHSHIANSLPSSKVAFIGLPVNIFKISPKDLEAVIGKITLKSFGKYAKPPKPHDAYDTLPKTYIFSIMPFMLKGMLKKMAIPNPLFQANGEPISKPENKIKSQKDNDKDYPKPQNVDVVSYK